MLELIKKVAIGTVVGALTYGLGKAVYLYGEKRYWEGKLMGAVECTTATIINMLDNHESKRDGQEETEEA